MNVNQKRTKKSNRRRQPPRRNPKKVAEFAEYERLRRCPIPKSLLHYTPFPPKYRAKLSFVENLVLQAAASFLVRDFRANSAWDPDPLIGGGSLSGFTELAAIYNFYTVDRVRLRYTVAANEPSLPCNFGFTFKDYQPSVAVTTYALALDILEVSPTTGTNVVGETAGQSLYRSKWTPWIHCGVVLGNMLQYYAEASYSATTNASPSQVIWASFVLLADTSLTNLTNGVIANFNFEFDVLFYSLSSSLNTTAQALTLSKDIEKKRLQRSKSLPQ